MMLAYVLMDWDTSSASDPWPLPGSLVQRYAQNGKSFSSRVRAVLDAEFLQSSHCLGLYHWEVQSP